MREENGVAKGLFIGLLTGAALGSVIALLYAPKSGKEFRSDIKSKSKDLLDDAEEYIEQAKDKATQLINDGKKKSDRLVAETKVKVDALISEAEDILTDAKGKAGIFVDSSKSKIEKESERLKTAVKAGVDAYKSEKA
ncbi:MAG: YtxH domain-containing protein [Melioribacteraceae bacterium]|nr:YtxH domain-containing protein [Melioribacteraceae bacterium]